MNKDVRNIRVVYESRTRGQKTRKFTNLDDAFEFWIQQKPSAYAKSDLGTIDYRDIQKIYSHDARKDRFVCALTDNVWW